jgi:hypothetical protein
MWENRSETLKEYTYDLILKRRKNARVECKIWENVCRKSASSSPRIRTSLYKAGLVYSQASLVLRTYPLPPYKKIIKERNGYGGRNLFENYPKNSKKSKLGRQNAS